MDDKKKRLLIVDDDRAILQSLKNLLEEEGYDVDTVKTGKEAIEKSEKTFYNLALLDIRLQDIDGTELLIKMHNWTPRTMKIMVTGYASLDNALRSLNFGADAYITKAIDPEQLLKVVREKLKEQEDAERMSEEKMAKWIETRVRKLEQGHNKGDNSRTEMQPIQERR